MHVLRITGENVKIKRILVFGSIGSGKSSLLELFKEWGAFTVDCDQLTHNILQQDLEVKSILKKRFGPSLFDFEGNLLRKKLAAIAFTDSKNLFDLEKILIPRVWTEMQKIYQKVRMQKYRAFVVEAPLYPRLDTQWSDFFDQKILVEADLAIRQNRYPSLNAEEFTAREQFSPLKGGNPAADLVFQNNQTINELKQQFLQKVTP